MSWSPDGSALSSCGEEGDVKVGNQTFRDEGRVRQGEGHKRGERDNEARSSSMIDTDRAFHGGAVLLPGK